MKKFLAMLLAMLMVLCSVAFADESATEGEETTAPATKTAATKPATYTDVIKAYTVTGADTDSIYPTETLKFTSEASTSNPDGGKANLTINDLTVTGPTDQKLTINVPSFTNVGTYHFTIKETTGSAQGVTYSTGTIAISVLVTYDYTDSDGDGYTMTANVGITNANAGVTGATTSSKTDKLTNEYDLGSLAVSKTVTGNMGDQSKEFNVTVTFIAETGKTVESAITYVDGTETKTIPADWTGTKTATITLKHGETVTFTDIPAGVTYTVVEDDYKTTAGYDDPEYDFSDETKKIAKSDEDTVNITNNKTASVDTGISLDNAPYMILMGLVVLAGAALIVKRSFNH